MTTSLAKKCRRGFALLLVATAAAAGGVAFARSSGAAATTVASAVPAVISCERDGLRYEYHVPTGGETLYDAERDPRGLVNVLRGHEETAAACRRDLAARFGVADVTDLRAGYADTIRRLRTLGYF
jgi:hypothetical protein